MNIYNIRDLLFLSDDALRQLPEAYQLLFEDGVTLTVFNFETRYSALFWKIFHQYPAALVRSNHHIRSILGDDDLDTKTHQKLTTNILRSIREDMHLDLPEQKEPLLALIMKTISDAQNSLAILTEQDVVSLDILDSYQIANHPKILELKAQAMENENLIAYVYEASQKEIFHNPDFDDNGLAKACRSRMVRPNQVNQCVLFRGITSEVDGTVFSKAIWSNYMSGNTGMYELGADSRTAAKSHFYTDTALKDSEYNARKFQLFSMSLERIIYHDCGTTKLTPWRVTGKQVDEHGVTQYSGDLNKLVGKYYKLDPADKEYRVIMGFEKDLDDKVVWLRTALTCKAKNPHEICHICAGRLSENISRFDNIGHLGTITIVNVLSQTILSFKHVITSATIGQVFLDQYHRQYLNTGDNGNGIYVNQVPKKKLYLAVSREEAAGLQDVVDKEVLQYLTLSRISQVSEIKLSVNDGKGHVEVVPLTTKVKDNPTMLSREFLGYLAIHGWSVDEDNNFLFDLAKWDFKQPILVMENKEESVVDLVNHVEKMVQSNKLLHKKRLVVADAPSILLQDLFALVNSKFNINILCFEIVVYALMTESEDSYALSRNAENPVLGIAHELMLHRTLGVAMSYQAHEQSLLSPGYFFSGTRPDSLMDVFLKPREVIEHYYGPQA